MKYLKTFEGNFIQKLFKLYQVGDYVFLRDNIYQIIDKRTNGSSTIGRLSTGFQYDWFIMKNSNGQEFEFHPIQSLPKWRKSLTGYSRFANKKEIEKFKFEETANKYNL